MRVSRRARRLLWLVVSVVALTIGAGTGAAAHTSIDLVDPPDGSRLESAPDVLLVEFGETLPLRDTHVRVALSSGRTVVEGQLTADTTAPVSAEGTFALPPDLATGSYVVTVTARGTDGHTVSDAFAFTVGDAPLVRSEGATSPTDAPGLVALAGLAGFLTSAGLAALGFVYVASWCWPGSTRSRLARRFLRAGAALVTVGTVADLVALGWAQDAGPAAVLSSPAGRLLVLRAIGLVLVLLAATAWARVDTSPRVDASPGGSRGARQNMLIMAAVPLLLGAVGTSHAAGDAWSLVTLLAGCVHAAAMALWLGGLAWLWRLSGDAGMPLAAVAGFSRTASACAATAVATGIFLAYRLTQGGSWEVLSSRYGLVLLAKAALVATLLALARRTHRAVQDAGHDAHHRPVTTGTASAVTAGTAAAVTADSRTATVTASAPQLARHRLSVALRAEAAAGTAVLVAAGVLTALGPGA